MNTKDFSILLSSLPSLTPNQRSKMKESIKALDDDKQVSVILRKAKERNMVCPHCGDDHIIHWGKSHGLLRYRCAECRRTFNPLTGTPLARLRHKDRWLEFATSIEEGESVCKAAERCGVHRNTAFRWRHRFLNIPSSIQAEGLNGIAKADETFFLRSQKGQRTDGRPPRKRGGKASKRGRSSEQVCVLVARDRSGATVSSVCESFNKETVANLLDSKLDEDVLLCTDDYSVYRAFSKDSGILHKKLNLSAGIRVIDKVFHIQNVNAYHSRLKSWIQRFRGVSTFYLPNYLGWHRLLESHKTQISPETVLMTSTGLSYQFPNT